MSQRDGSSVTLMYYLTGAMKQNNMLKAYVWLISTMRDSGPITLRVLDERWRKDEVDEGNELNR